jgi:hypothetical protein
MFCNRCGAQVPFGFTTCLHCVRQTGDPTGALAQSRLDRHLWLLGILWIVMGGLFLVPALGLMAFGGGLNLVVHNHQPIGGLFPLLLYVIGGSLTILGAGGVCVGLGLMQRTDWARVTAIVLGILALLHPPFGTALGIYTLWVLASDEGGHEYRYMAGHS